MSMIERPVSIMLLCDTPTPPSADLQPYGPSQFAATWPEANQTQLTLPAHHQFSPKRASTVICLGEVNFGCYKVR